MALSRLDKEQYAREIVAERLDDIDFSDVYENDEVLESGASDGELREIHDIAKAFAQKVKELI